MSTVEELKKEFPKAYNFVMDNMVKNTDGEYLRCNRCGLPVLFETFVEGYPYQCIVCDENMFNIETYWGTAPTEKELAELIDYTAGNLCLDTESEGK